MVYVGEGRSGPVFGAAVITTSLSAKSPEGLNKWHVVQRCSQIYMKMIISELLFMSADDGIHVTQ